jgi:pimeloyl-ACP methyl ester carboxylesterase
VKTVTLDHRWMTLAYDERGAGRPLVLLHAFPLDREMWQPQLDGLSSAARVIAVDLPEFGRSTPGQDRLTVEHTADALADFLPAVGITGPAVVGGLSMGGYVALAFARRHPRQLAGLILADTRAEADDLAGRAARDDMISLAKAAGADAVMEKMLPKLLSEAARRDRPELVGRVRAIGARQGVSAITAALSALRDRPDATASLGSIAVPTLVIVGEHDAPTPPPLSQKMAGLIPGSRLVTIPGAGHLSNLENPDAFNAAVREFLSAI